MVFIWVGICTLAVLYFHELGHVVTARLFGIAVERVSIGLGPELAAVTDRCGTTWRLALWPIGAYTIYESARDGSEKRPCELPSRWAVAMIFAAGSVSNIFLSILVLLLAWISGHPVRGFVALSEPVPGAALLFAGISITMGVFNLLPAPPLDGWLLTRLALGYECSFQTSQ